MVEQWIVAPKVEGSSPSSYLLNLTNFLNFYNFFLFKNSLIINNILIKFLSNLSFLPNYYLLNELIWQEGLLIDFLQKKMTDNWIKKFLIYSAYLFSEKLMFDNVIRFYLNLLIHPINKIFVFEFNNITNLLSISMFFFIFVFFIIILIFFFLF